MHIVQNVCGCIDQLMMGSDLADLIGSHWRSWQHHGSRETMGACDALIQDGIFSSLAIIPADRIQDVR